MEEERGKTKPPNVGEKRKTKRNYSRKRDQKNPTINAQKAKNKLRSPSGMTSNPVGRRRVHTGIFSSSFLSRNRSSSSSRFQSSFLSLDSLRSLIILRVCVCIYITRLALRERERERERCFLYSASEFVCERERERERERVLLLFARASSCF